MFKTLKSGLIMVGIFTLSLFIGLEVANAQTCSNEIRARLNEAAQKVRAVIEVVETPGTGEWHDDEAGLVRGEDIITYSFKITVYNVGPGMYVSMNNGMTKENTILLPDSPEGGDVVYTTDNITDVITYTLTVFANVEECGRDTLRTFTVVKPMYNWYSETLGCRENPTVTFCHKFVTKEVSIPDGDIRTAIEEYIGKEAEKASNNKESLWGWLGDNIIYIVIGVLAVAGIAGGTIYIVRRRRII